MLSFLGLDTKSQVILSFVVWGGGYNTAIRAKITTVATPTIGLFLSNQKQIINIFVAKKVYITQLMRTAGFSIQPVQLKAITSNFRSNKHKLAGEK
jgi:hypothetical protein